MALSLFLITLNSFNFSCERVVKKSVIKAIFFFNSFHVFLRDPGLPLFFGAFNGGERKMLTIKPYERIDKSCIGFIGITFSHHAAPIVSAYVLFK